MLKFDICDPYPLLPETSFLHEEAKQHAQLVDDWLGVKVQEIEATVQMDERYNPFSTHEDRPFLSEYWRGLPPESLQTPYAELRAIVSEASILDNNTVVDLGSGYSRMAFVLKRHAPSVRFIGIEYVEQRHLEAKRLAELHGLENANLICADLSSDDFVLPVADVYFIYDFGSKPAIRKTLLQIQEIAFNRPITVVGRGRSSRDLIEKENPWLSEIIQPKHFRNFSIYRNR